MTHEPSRGLSLHTKILIGLIGGAVCGLLVNTYAADNEQVAWVREKVFGPVGKVFLRLLLMTVVPLVFASLAVGVARLGDLRQLGRVGAKTFAFFVATMTCAVVIGLGLVNAVRPGDNISEETREKLLKRFAAETKKKLEKPAEFGVDTFVNIVPRNPVEAAANMDMLGIIFFALVFGVGVTTLSGERSSLMIQGLDALGDVMVFIIGLAMRLAPFGVFALIFNVTSEFGFDVLKSLAVYVAIVLIGLAIQMFVVLSILVRVLGGLNPWTFFRRVRNVLVTAFSTSSSNATLPTTIKTAEEELGIPPQLAGFVLPLGATMNMNGTALFEGVTVVFLAQVFNKDLSLGQQAVVVVLSVLTAIGAAGVPGGSIPLLAMVLASVNVPPEGIAIIIGVDRLLDMCRTTLNVVGDIAAATYVARSEGFPLLGASKPPPTV